MDWEGPNPSPRRWHSVTRLPNSSDQALLYAGYDGDKQNHKNDLWLANFGM